MNTWYVYRDGQQYGPFADTDLIGWAHAGYLAPTDLVWRQGMETWKSALEVPGLFSAVPQISTVPTYQPLAGVPGTRPTSSAQTGTAPHPQQPRRKRTSGPAKSGEGRFRGSLLLFILTTTLVLLALAWLFTQGDKEDALVLWTWVAVLLIGLFGLGLPLAILFSGRRMA